MDDDQLTRLPFAIVGRNSHGWLKSELHSGFRQQFYMQFARNNSVSSTRFYRINYKMKKGNYE